MSGELNWIKARASVSTGACVEMAVSPDGSILMRNSREPGDLQQYTYAEFEAFLGGAKKGEFDQLLAQALRNDRN